MRRVFWIVSSLLAGTVIVRGYDQAPVLGIGAALIIASALLPNYLWVMGKVSGLPIFPLYALTSIWIYALPLVSKHPIIILFPPEFQMRAALSVSGFLLLGTWVWYRVSRRPVKPVTTCWMFDERQKDSALLVVFGVTFIALLAISTGLISGELRIFTALRAVLLAVQALLCFSLSYRLGQGKLSLVTRIAFYFLVGGSVLVNLVSLLMVGAMSLLGLSTVAYTIGSKRVAWRVCLISVLLFGFLHNGKALMREKYWLDGEFTVLSPLNYVSFLTEWTEDSWDVIRHGDPDQSASLQQRASLMHLLLYFQSASPANLPFLLGESYKSILIQFVPRMFYPEKPRSLEGAYVVCIYYNLQTREDTDLISIDVGLINEAYANFGFIGMGVLAVVLGGCFAAVSNWARGMPVFSFRTLFAVSVLAGLLQAGTCVSMYVATLYQDTIVLLLVAAVLMRPTPYRRIEGQFV